MVLTKQEEELILNTKNSDFLFFNINDALYIVTAN